METSLITTLDWYVIGIYFAIIGFIAWWYGRDKTPKGPAEFWEDLEGLVDRGLVELVERLGHRACRSEVTRLLRGIEIVHDQQRLAAGPRGGTCVHCAFRSLAKRGR